MKTNKNYSIIAALIALGCVSGATASAAGPSENPRPDANAQAAARNSDERNFYEVLDDLLGDFEYDLKNGNVQGLKDLSIRNVSTSENIPASFKNHLELVVTERILKTAKVRMVQCLPCKSKKTTLNGDQVIITSTDTNPQELARIAKIAGISSFMDIAFSYQPSGMVLSMFIMDPDSGGIVWSRSYNSETSRAAAYRRGVDFSQIEEARKSTEYTPTIQYRATVGYLSEPNIGVRTGCLGLGFRMMERYDNRKKEVGFELMYLKDATSFVGSSSTAANLYSGLNLTLLFTHAWNLIGEEENFNRMRGSIVAAIGGTYASGYLGGLARGGYEWRLGKHSAVSAMLGYRPKSTAFVGASEAGAVAGIEAGLGVSYIF